MSKLLVSFRSHATSRLALGLGIAHAVLFVALILSAPKAPPPAPDPPCSQTEIGCTGELNFVSSHDAVLAGRDVQGHVGFKVLALTTLPALFLVGYSVEPILGWLEPSPLRDSYIIAAAWLLTGTAQWWLIGVLLNVRKERHRRLKTSGGS